MSKWKIVLISGSFVVFFLSGLTYCVISLLASGDCPRFEDEDWRSLHVMYSVVRDNHRFDHHDMSLAGNELSELQKLFLTKTSIKTRHSPYPKNLRLELKNGDQWGIAIGAVNELFFHDQNVTYRVELTDTRFYEKLREHCWEDVVRIIPECKIENVRVAGHSLLVTKRDDMHAKGIGIGLEGKPREQCMPLLELVEQE